MSDFFFFLFYKKWIQLGAARAWRRRHPRVTRSGRDGGLWKGRLGTAQSPSTGGGKDCSTSRGAAGAKGPAAGSLDTWSPCVLRIKDLKASLFVILNAFLQKEDSQVGSRKGSLSILCRHSLRSRQRCFVAKRLLARLVVVLAHARTVWIIFCDDVHFNICSLNTKLRLSIGARRRRVAKGKAMWKENAITSWTVTSDICVVHSKQLFMS